MTLLPSSRIAIEVGLLHTAVRFFRGVELVSAYEDAFGSWDASEDAGNWEAGDWDATVSDSV